MNDGNTEPAGIDVPLRHKPGHRRGWPDRWLLGAVLLLQVVVIIMLALWFRSRNEPMKEELVAKDESAAPPWSSGSALSPVVGPQAAAAAFQGFDDECFARDMQAMFATSRARFRTMEAEMQRMLELDGGWDVVGLAPSMDLQVRGSNYVILVSLPGVDPTNLHVSVEGRLLSVRATSRVSSGRSSGYQTMERRLMLPCVPGEGEAMASFSNGLLRVCIPVKN
jgi:HSP20 family molecular chaperone IbpA